MINNHVLVWIAPGSPETIVISTGSHDGCFNKGGICSTVATVKRSLFIYLGFVLALVSWLLETADDVFIFHMATFSERLFPFDPNELWMRTVVCGLVIAFAAYAQRATFIIAKLHKEKTELHKRLAETLTLALSRYIVICAWCKSVRNEKGHWQSVEEFVQCASVKSELTHGICERCAEKRAAHL